MVERDPKLLALFTVAVGAVTQTGGGLAISGSPVAFNVAGIYDFNGGTASVYPVSQTMTNSSSSFGQLLVRAESFTLGGIAYAQNGIHVASGGRMLIESLAEVAADVLNEGRLDVALTTEITGDFVNNSVFHIGYFGWASGLETVDITGSFMQSSTGTLLVDTLDGNYMTDFLAVSGLATLGGTLQVASDDFDPNTIGKIGTYGSRSGTFATLVVPSGSLEIWYDDPTANAFGIKPGRRRRRDAPSLIVISAQLVFAQETN